MQAQKIAEEVKIELKEIKGEIQKPMFEDAKELKVANKQENLTSSDGFCVDVVTKSDTSSLNPLKLLGELLSFLRKERSMSLLMLCRQISKIEIEDKTAIIYSDDDEILMLQTNERYHSEMSKFFESKGLSFKVQENIKETTEVDRLKELLGNKLVIK